MNGPSLPRLIGVVLLTMSATIIVGWLTRTPAVLQAVPGYLMPFNAAVCFALAALALIVDGPASSPRRGARAALGASIMVIAGTTLAQHALRVDIGIDLPELHRWLAGNGARPGRMPVVTCLAFFMSGAVLMLQDRVTTTARAHLLRCFTLAIGAIGMLTVGGQILGLQQVFEAYLFSQIALLTAAGLAVLSIGLWTSWRSQPWNEPRIIKSDINRIMLASAATTIAIAAVCSFAGFIVMQRGAEKSLGDDLARILDTRIAEFTRIVDRRLDDAGRLALHPLVADELAALVVPSTELRSRRLLTAFAVEALTDGYSAVTILDANGNEVVASGKRMALPELSLRLQRPGVIELVWTDDFLLHTQTVITGYGRTLGTVIAQQPLPEMNELLQRIQDAGETGELLICAPGATDIECAPTRLRKRPFRVPRSRPDKQPTVFGLALDGARGVRKFVDRNGNEAIAAYAPAGNLGPGMILRQNTVELYAPIREQLLQLVPLITILLVAGIGILRSLIMPLTRELALSEERLQLALDGSRLALWDWDYANGRIYLSQNWQVILGGDARPVNTTPDALESRVHPDDLSKMRSHLSEVLRGIRKQYDLEYRVRTLSGEWKWIHSKGNVVERLESGYATRLTGTNADIDQHKQASLLVEHQARHDALTGLPNRTLFHEHLKHAMASSRRHGRLMAVLYLDIDRFKTINDTLGHAAGDALLRAFTQRLADCVRRADTVARMAGDEFTVILEELEHRDDGTAVARKIVEAMRAGFVLDAGAVTVTTSIGIAFFEGEDNVRDDELVKHADTALYEAKGAGRDGYHIAVG